MAAVNREGPADQLIHDTPKELKGQILDLVGDGIIGHTGFVGGCLTAQHGFAGQFNSRNIDEIGHSAFETVVCAAAPGSMLAANTAPERDKAQIEQLCAALSQVRTKRFVLISSIAVLADFAGKDVETTQAFQDALAYGRHRRMLEAFCQDHFEDTLILRLPALYGTGLKKNFLFDLLNPVPSLLNTAKMESALACVAAADQAVLKKVYRLNPDTNLFVLDRVSLHRSGAQPRITDALVQNDLTAVQFTHHDTTFQFYGLDRLWADIARARAAGLSILHLATAPLRASAIHHAVTGRAMPDTQARLHHEDMHSAHAGLWGQNGPYLEGADDVMTRVLTFCRQQRVAA